MISAAFLTVAEAVTYLESRGYRMSGGTLYSLLKTKRIPSRRYGTGRGTFKVASADLDAYIASIEAEVTPAALAVRAKPSPPSVSSARPSGTRKHLGKKARG